MIYGVLYDAMLLWYRRRGIEEQYLKPFVTFTMTVVAFVNVLSATAFLGYMGVGIARQFLSDSKVATVLFGVLLILHLVYLRSRRASEPERAPGLRWIAPAYIFGSVALVCYMSTLISTFKS